MKKRCVVKGGKCECGRKITHHHKYCNLCWKINGDTYKLKRKMEKEIKDKLKEKKE